VPASDLSGDDLRRDFAHLIETEDDIAQTGTGHQQENYAARAAQLRREFGRRFGPSSQSGDR
jgi:hypothetical protein